MLTLATAARNAMVNALTALIDAGGGQGKIVIGSSGMAATLVTCLFSADSFSDGDTGVATSNAITDGTVALDGTAAEAKLVDKNDASIVSGLSVGTSASNINLTSVGLKAGDKVAFGLGDMTITQPAS
jgi:hypothetical protein